MEEQRKRVQALDYDSDDARRDAIKAKIAEENAEESIGMGPGRTGVKGVIRDRNEALEREREKKERELEATRLKMEKANLGGKTYLEEEREKAARGEKADDLVYGEHEKSQALRHDRTGLQKQGRFGHLREIGVKNFLNAVEKEERGIWVVVHLFDPVSSPLSDMATHVDEFRSPSKGVMFSTIHCPVSHVSTLIPNS